MEDRTLQAFFDRLDEDQRLIALVLHEVIMGVDADISTKMRYRIPFYDYGTWFCYINPLKDRAVELCFLYAAQLDDPFGLLDFKKRKMVGGVTCHDTDSIPYEAISDLVQLAITLAAKE